MRAPPLDPRDRPFVEQPTWRGILVSYALVAAVPLLLWVSSHQLAGAVTLALLAGLFVGGRGVFMLTRCFHVCQEFTVDLGGTAWITVAQIPTDEAS